MCSSRWFEAASMCLICFWAKMLLTVKAEGMLYAVGDNEQGQLGVSCTCSGAPVWQTVLDAGIILCTCDVLLVRIISTA
eukprot:5758729-Amphidinium_carterae.1